MKKLKKTVFFAIIISFFLVNCPLFALAPLSSAQKFKQTVKEVRKKVEKEFDNAEKYFKNNSEKILFNNKTKKIILNLLDKYLSMVENNEINSIDINSAPISFSVISGDPVTWGHIELILQGMIKSKSPRGLIVSAEKIKKAGISSKEKRFASISKINEFLAPLISFYPLKGESSTKEEGKRTLEVALAYPEAENVYFVSGDDKVHLEEAPEKLSRYANKNAIPLKKINLIYVSRFLKFNELEKTTSQLQEKFSQLGGIQAVEGDNDYISSSNYRDTKVPIIPNKVRIEYERFSTIEKLIKEITLLKQTKNRKLVGVIEPGKRGKTSAITQTIKAKGLQMINGYEVIKKLEKNLDPEIKNELIEALGSDIINEDGSINRASLYQPHKSATLNKIIYSSELIALLGKILLNMSSDNNMTFLDLPDLHEFPAITKLCDEVIYIDHAEKKSTQDLKEQNRTVEVTGKPIENRLTSETEAGSSERYKSIATIIINNKGSKKDGTRYVKECLDFLKEPDRSNDDCIVFDKINTQVKPVEKIELISLAS